ncbi:acyl-CoA dehydrogenase family protein [Comamonas endophytica]|uniref:Acyl-CoA dehydrogenase family protein n=1 Tax=Comamonas endophytica TaxID=2949090 RepID=A0ABY6GBY6_9BURK|nr:MULTISPECIES: acyl-CoA dehydrogenase family protein [unclassified Acidovorax]MCD2513107.1 acyl-CoA dehydrogenase family protein [Acidovorax sp. D4N7]UYG52554.1 acyl-CoA dehydrogenase family protein [Acidovorax sp. 5MLIR]
MDFNFSEDQQQLRDAVRRWVDKGYSFERRRTEVAGGGFSRATYGELAELGLTALVVPEAHGGLGQGAVEVMVAMEELGRGIVLAPLAQAVVASAVLCQYAPAAVQALWQPRIASGDALVVLAHQERKARYRLDECSARAVAGGSGHLLTGLKSLVPAGDQADAFLVPAKLDDQIALFLVERAAAGVRTRGYVTQDGSRAAELECTDSPATLLTHNGLTALTLAMDVANAALCAEAVGVMEQTLAITVDYMNQRKQFGVAIASFQALRHRVADMKMQLELARSMSYYASLKITAPAAERHLAVARARVQLGQAMRFIGQQAVQLHGGIGVTDEYIVSHYFKRLTQMEMTFGDSLHHLCEVSAGMQETAGVFA